MLKPDPNDPNYKEQQKLYEKEPWRWGPGALPPSGVPPQAVEEKPKASEKK